MNPPLTHPDRPIPNSYWVIPWRFLAGEYPGAKDEEGTRAKIRRFFQAGITRFIDLTHVGETNLRPYAGMLAEEARRQESDRLVKTVLHTRLPIDDMSTPSQVEMGRIQAAIHKALQEGETIYLHCWGGRGRTGTVVGCYLVEQGMSGEQALEQIRTWRQVTEKAHLPSPETFAQEAMVLNWSPFPLEG
jgi:hypothetical protein